MTEAMFKEAVKNRTPIPIDVPLGDLKANMVVGGVGCIGEGGCRGRKFIRLKPGWLRWWQLKYVLFSSLHGGDDPI